MDTVYSTPFAIHCRHFTRRMLFPQKHGGITSNCATFHPSHLRTWNICRKESKPGSGVPVFISNTLRAPSLKSKSCYNTRMATQQERALEIHRRLLAEYGEPVWRTPLPALDELVSTILSQNTNDVNRDRAFEALRARFPSWESVRDANSQAVIDAIRSAGLANQKGPRIQKILRAISEERGALDLGFLKSMPPEQVRKWLLSFKGVGPKTAAIVMQFSLEMPAFPVDTHIYRLSGRLGLREAKMSADAAHSHLEKVFPSTLYYAAHLNLIQHGRQICHARNPECARCVLRDLCLYDQQNSNPPSTSRG